MLPSQVQRLQIRVQIRFGDDWVDVSDRLLAQQVAIKRGRADESAQVQPTTASMTLSNLDSALTPLHPLSPWYPHVRRGAPLRLSVAPPGGPVALDLPGTDGSYASAPDMLAVTDLDVRAEITPSSWAPGVDIPIVSQFGPAGSSWIVYLNDAGLVGVLWAVGASTTSQRSTVPVPATSGRLAVRWTLDVDDGSGGHQVIFYVAESLAGPWTQLGGIVTVAGTTSIAASTAPVEVGAYGGGEPGSTFEPLAGRVHGVEILDGIGGTIVADPDFGAQPAGTTSFSDSSGNAWSLHGGASIAAWQTRFVGAVDEWSPTWPYGDLSDEAAGVPGEARVDITASGMLRRLSQGEKPLRSSITRLASAPINEPMVVAHWPLEDGRDATSAASPTPGVTPMLVGGAWQFAVDDTLAGSDSLPTVSGGQPAGFNAGVPPAPPGQWSVDLFVRVPTPETAPTVTPLIVIRTSGSPINGWRLDVSDTNWIVVPLIDDLEFGPVVYGVHGDVFFEGWTFIRFTSADDGAGNVDWSWVWTPIGSFSAGAGDSYVGTSGRVTAIQNLLTAPPDGISYGHIVVGHDLVLGWVVPAHIGWVGETAGDRIVRLAREEEIPVSIVGDPDDTAAMGPQRVETLLDLLGECATADGGILSEQRSAPGLQYRTRRSLYNQSAGLALDAGTSDITHPFEPRLDDARLRNDVEVARSDGSSAHVLDHESISESGLYDESVTLNVESDRQLPDQAGWRLALGTWPGLRYPSVASELSIAPHLVDSWLGVDLGDRVTVDGLPPQHPSDTVDLHIQGYREQLSPTRWTPELTCSPAGPWTVGVLGDAGALDTGLDRVASDGSEVDVAVDGDDTSLSVAVTAGPLWVTDSGQLPLDIVVGGERMTVTAITGTTSPQTFTVVRSVNGVSKSHAVGTPVQVADPIRLAL